MHSERRRGVHEDLLGLGISIFVGDFFFKDVFDSFGLYFDGDWLLMIKFSEILVGLLGFFNFLDDLFWSVFFLNVKANVRDELLDLSDNFVDFYFLDFLGVPLLFGEVGKSGDAYGFVVLGELNLSIFGDCESEILLKADDFHDNDLLFVSFAELTLISEKLCVFLWLKRAFYGWD